MMKLFIMAALMLSSISSFAADYVCSNFKGFSVTHDSGGYVDSDTDGFSGDSFYIDINSNSMTVEMRGNNNRKEVATLSNKSNDGWSAYTKNFTEVQRTWIFYKSKKLLQRIDVQTQLVTGKPEVKITMGKCRQLKFINTEPRKTRHIPEWSKNLEHEESRLWLMNTYEMAHVQELIEACEYQRLQWIEKGLRSPESELPTEDFNEVFNMIEKQHDDLLKHLHAIEEKNRQIQEELGDDWLKEKEQ